MQRSLTSRTVGCISWRPLHARKICERSRKVECTNVRKLYRYKHKQQSSEKLVTFLENRAGGLICVSEESVSIKTGPKLRKKTLHNSNGILLRTPESVSNFTTTTGKFEIKDSSQLCVLRTDSDSNPSSREQRNSPNMSMHRKYYKYHVVTDSAGKKRKPRALFDSGSHPSHFVIQKKPSRNSETIFRACHLKKDVDVLSTMGYKPHRSQQQSRDHIGTISKISN